MTQKHLQQILSDYSQMSVDSLIELKNLVEDYPYCQTAQILYLLNLKRLGEDMFDIRLPHTAICVNSRPRLKEHVDALEALLSQAPPAAAPNPKSKIQYPKSVKVPEIKSFHTKTISDLLNLPKPPKPSSLDRIKLPQNATSDDILLEQMRQEALAKVNERLGELRRTKIVTPNTPKSPKRMTSAKDLIDKVIETNPKISKVEDSENKQRPLTHWKAKEERSLREDYEMVSETLAQLYIAQGAPAKAREIYKTLSRQFPERADHFNQISKQIQTIHKPKTKK